MIWNLSHNGLDYFQKHFYHIRGNGNKTFSWHDSIMGHAPLINSEEIKEVHIYLILKGIQKMVDISSWDATGN